MAGIGGGGHTSSEFRDIAGTAHPFEHAAGRERVGEGDRVNRLIALAQRDHRAKYLAMRLAIKILGGQNLDSLIDRVVVEQNCAQYRLFGFDILRRYTFEDIIPNYA